MVDILLSTYNGEKFLSEQLDSIINQSYTDWKLIIRDDGSSDTTPMILNKYVNEYPEKIFVLEIDGINLGPTLSFSKLLKNTQEEYIMLCDQDDVWFQNKIEVSIAEIKKLEANFQKQTPLLAFTDLIEVDKHLNVISDSFIKSQKLDSSIISSPKKLAALNIVAGCTTIFNKCALSVILPLNSKYVTHDQWIAVNIAHYGKIAFYPHPTIFYRQHTNNVLGSNNIKLKYFISKLLKPKKQFRIYFDLLSQLNFKITIFSFIYYKTIFSIKRII